MRIWAWVPMRSPTPPHDYHLFLQPSVCVYLFVCVALDSLFFHPYSVKGLVYPKSPSNQNYAFWRDSVNIYKYLDERRTLRFNLCSHHSPNTHTPYFYRHFSRFWSDGTSGLCLTISWFLFFGMHLIGMDRSECLSTPQCSTPVLITPLCQLYLEAKGEIAGRH